MVKNKLNSNFETINYLFNQDKKKVLTYHPDKAKQSGQPSRVEESELFTCITKAFEILTDPIKRRSFDSVDPTFEDDIPSISEKAKNNFYQVFERIFTENSRYVCVFLKMQSFRSHLNIFFKLKMVY